MMVTVCKLNDCASNDDYPSSDARRLLDDLFGFQKPHYCAAERIWSPPTDVVEMADAIIIKMELAGVAEEDVQVRVNDNYLVIRGVRHDEHASKPENFHLMEIHYGQFERIFRLPSGMKISNVTAVLMNGFLRITVPKDRRILKFCIEIE